MPTKILFFLMLAIAGCAHATPPCAFESALGNPTLIASLSAIHASADPAVPTYEIQDLLAAAHAPSVSIAVREADGPIFAATFGESRSSATLSPTTLYQAGSISKAVWALALLARSDTAAWLDVDVRTALPELQAPHEITPRMLLSHSSGASVHGFLGYRPAMPRPTLEQIVRGQSPANSEAVTFGPAGRSRARRTRNRSMKMRRTTYAVSMPRTSAMHAASSIRSTRLQDCGRRPRSSCASHAI